MSEQASGGLSQMYKDRLTEPDRERIRVLIDTKEPEVRDRLKMLLTIFLGAEQFGTETSGTPLSSLDIELPEQPE
jgi:hypothetical protein